MPLKIVEKPISDRTNSNFDCSNNEYKIFKLTNMNTGMYYISYTRNKYLSRVKEDLLRKPTENFRLLFNGITDKNDIMVELLNIVEADNIYFVKQHIKQIEIDVNKAIIKRCDKPIINKDMECKECDDDKEDDNKTIKTTKKEIKSINEVKELNKIQKANEPKKKYNYPNKVCDICNQSYTYKNYSRHRKICSKQ